MKLFTLGPDYLVDINKEELSTIAEYRKLIRRDRGSEGDHDGRKKLQARKEFTFIYHYCRYDSDFAQMPEDEKYRECLKAAELPEDFKVFNDADLVNAIERFEKNQNTRSLRLLKSVRKSVDELTVYYEELKFSGDGKKVKEYLAGINILDNAISRLDSLEERVKRELAEEASLRGDAIKGAREDRPTKTWSEE